jgi:putative ABC transport system permease protein
MKGSMTNTDQLGYQILRIYNTIQRQSAMLIWCQFPEFIDIKGLEFEKGRFYNESEANSEQMCCFVAAKLQALLNRSETLRIRSALYLIGVLKKQGAHCLARMHCQLYSG